MAATEGTLAGIILTWVLGGVLALTGAFVFAELGSRFPRTGGQYVYLREAFGPRLAFFYGWNLLAIVASGALAVVASVSVFNLDILLRDLAADPSRPFFSNAGQAAAGAGLIAFFTWINIRGVRLGARVHNVLMALKIASLLFVILLGAWWHLEGTEPWSPGREMRPFVEETRTLALALLAALFSYGGWQNAASVAGEVKDASRMLPRALVIGTLAVVALYLGVNLAVARILGVEGVAATPTPVADAAGRVLGRGGRVLVAGMVVVSTIGITHALLLMTPRVYYAMARDRTFFAACAREHPRFATPHIAILLQAGFTLVHIAVAAVEAGRTGKPLSDVIGDLLDALVFVDWVFFALVGVGYFLLRGRRAEAPRPYRAPGHPWVPLVYLVLASAIVAWTVFDVRREVLIIPAVVFSAGAVLLFARRRVARG